MDDISDRQWRVISRLLPLESDRGRPADNTRRCLNGMLWILRMGVPWRELPQRYGKWNSVYKRFRRWGEQGVWEALLEPLVRLGLTHHWEPLPKSSTVKPRGQSGAFKKLSTRKALVEAAASLRAELSLGFPSEPEPQPTLKAGPKRRAAPLSGTKRAAESSKPATKRGREQVAESKPAPKRLRKAVKRKTRLPDWNVLEDIADRERTRRRIEKLVRPLIPRGKT